MARRSPSERPAFPYEFIVPLLIVGVSKPFTDRCPPLLGLFDESVKLHLQVIHPRNFTRIDKRWNDFELSSLNVYFHQIDRSYTQVTNAFCDRSGLYS